LWVYTNGVWINSGRISGPQGIQGGIGIQGVPGFGIQGAQGLRGNLGETLWAKTDVGINTASNVGIGTTSPTEKLTVLGSVGVGGSLIFNDNAGVASVIVAIGTERFLQNIIIDCGSY
jgi:hypothetical protein